MGTRSSELTSHAPATGRARRPGLGSSKTFWAYVFVLPNFLLVAAFALYPLVYNMWLSLRQWSFQGTQTEFVGLANYGALLNNPTFWISLRNTIMYTAMAVPVTVGLALAVAVALNQRIHGRTVLRVIYLLPFTISWVVAGLIWQWIFSANYGILNAGLEALGLPTSRWLQDTNLTLLCIGVASVWRNLGYFMVILLAGLQGVPEVYYEAARTDGATAFARFRYITLPLLQPILFMVLILSMLDSFRAFDQIYVMTGGGPGLASMVLIVHLYFSAFEEMRLGYAAALSVVFFIIVLSLTMVGMWLRKEE